MNPLIEIEKRLMNPKPGSPIETAKNFGIDLTLVIEQLRLTPDERVRHLQKAINALSEIQGKSVNSK